MKIVVQNRLFCPIKQTVLHGKMIHEIQLIENEEVTMLVKLNR